jgi:hypothetical protein
VGELLELLGGDLAGRVRADGLEDVADRDVAALEVTGRDGAAVEQQAGDVEPGERHHGAGDRLVAGREADDRVEEVRGGHELDRVGDDLTAHEARAHAARAHRDAV